MRIAVVGAGGVGGYFGGRLAAAGEDITFVVKDEPFDTLRVDSVKGDFVVEHPKVTNDPSTIGNVDAVLMCVKAWQVPEATRSIVSLIGQETVVVPLENGMEAPEQIAAIVGREHASGGLCGIIAFLVGNGHIRHVGAEPFLMCGELDNRPSARLERLCEALVRAGVKAEIPPDIHRSMWSKFLFIVPGSGIGAITRVPVSVWRAMPETRELAERCIREILAVAAARGAALPADAFERTMERLDGLPADATTSLQRDMMDGKPSELDAQLGAVVRMAAESGVDVPVCDFLYRCLLPQERSVRTLSA
ncbi:MAG TPA: 2-dehydropantoate 2-reductase [Thermoanaerobaculia bacterium]